MTMSTQTLDEAARQLAAAVLVDSIQICQVAEPVTTGIRVTRALDFHTAWEEDYRNYLLDPEATLIGTAGWLAAGGITHTIAEEGIRATRTTTAVSATYIHRNRPEMPRGTAGQVWTFSLDMRADVPQNVILGLVQNNTTTALNATTFSLTTEWQRFTLTAELNSTWIGQILSPRIGMSLNSSGVGSWWEYKNAQLELSSVAHDPISGDTAPAGELIRTRWLGTPSFSPSVRESRAPSPTLPGLVQTTVLANAVESRSDAVYSIKVAKRTALNAGDAVRVVSCTAEPDLVGKVLLVDKMSKNGLAMIRKGVASDWEIVNQQGKEGMS